jgi:hypothetical protein
MIPKCANCGIPIRWLPTRVDDAVYCCVGCAAGGPCECDYARLPQPDQAAPLVRRARHRNPERVEGRHRSHTRDRAKRTSPSGVEAL